jgi:hypothetical protein
MNRNGMARFLRFDNGYSTYQFIGMAIIFALFFSVFQYMWYEHDDYGYATLKYATHPDFQSQQKFLSTEFSLLDLFIFLKHHYTTWGGRVAPFFFLCLLLKFPPIVFSILQTTITVLSIWFVNKSNPPGRSLLLNGLIAFLVLAMPLPLFRDGVMWMTASILYYWGGLLLILALFVLIRFPGNVISYFLIFLVSMWQENISLALLGTATMLALFYFQVSFWRRLAVILSSGVGAVLLVFSPGNFVRMGHECCKSFYELGFIERTILGLGRVANYYVYHSTETLPIFLFLGLGVLLLLFLLYKQSGNKRLYWLSVGYAVGWLWLFAIAKKILVLSPVVSGLFFIVFMAVSCFVVLYDYRKNRNIFYVALFSSFCFMLLSGSLSPYGGSRSLVPLYLLSLFFLFSVIDTVFTFYKLKPYVLALAVLSLAAGLSTSLIYKASGYQKNYHIHQQNHQKLLDASRQKEPIITLASPQDEFINNPIRNTMYQVTWIRFFYNISRDVKIELSENTF